MGTKRSKTRHSVYPCVLMLLLMAGVGSIFADEIPEVLRPSWPELSSYPQDIPVWVAASRAFDENGHLIPALFRDESRLRLEKVLRNPKDPATGCTKMLWIDVSYVDPPDRSSIALAVRSSETVIWGKIVATETGFVRGEVGQMLMVQPLEILKATAAAPERFYYVFVPAGRFRFAGYEVCKEDPRIVVPVVGEEVVLFPRWAPAGEPFLNLEYEGSLLAFDAEGKVRLPPVMARTLRDRENLITPADVLGEIRSVTRGAKP